MKAIVFEETGGPDVLKIKDVKKPEAKQGQVLVKIHVIGVNPYEAMLRQGRFGPVKFPYIAGLDGAGVVQSVGENVTKFKAGDRVWIFQPNCNGAGTYAEYVAVPEELVHHLPDNCAFKEGAALAMYLTGTNAILHTAKAKPGECVLVHGASGGIGIPTVQLAKALGLIVIGTASTDDGQILVKENGAHHVFNHKSEDYVEKIKDVTNRKGPDIIIEMAVNVNLKKDMEMIAKGGRIVAVGGVGTTEINPGLLLLKKISILGVGMFDVDPVEMQEDAALINAGVEQGWLKPLVGRVYPMEKAADAHRDIEHGKSRGKMVLIVN